MQNTRFYLIIALAAVTGDIVHAVEAGWYSKSVCYNIHQGPPELMDGEKGETKDK